MHPAALREFRGRRLVTYDDLAYHYSLLRTIEDGFGISDYLGSAKDVASLNTFWRPFPL